LSAVPRDVSDDLNHPGLAFAEEAGLSYCNDRAPGLSRERKKNGDFVYRDRKGETITDARTLDRIAALAIPPAWTEVWICPRANGHIQAIGRDAKGRKQYRYHAQWRAVRDEAKYGRMIAFGRKLPKLRRRVEADLALRGLPREKVLAAVVRLLEVTLIRVGNEEYARTNKSFGLTTMQKRHVKVAGAGAVFEFRGKSGVAHRTGFHDRRLVRIVRACQDLRGQRLFQYVDETGERRAIESHDVNDYLREAMGGEFTAKDFRTWAASLSAMRALAEQPPPKELGESQAALKRTTNLCVKAVAGLLGNTPAVCRAAYIHPAVFTAYEEGRLSKRAVSEGALLRLLKHAQAKAA
jgi:DNA topoisomerase-1